MDGQAFSRNRPFSEGESSCLYFHPPPAMNREEGKGARAGRLPGILRNHRAAKRTGRMIPPWHTQSPAHGKGRGERFGYHSHEAVCSALAFGPERRASPPADHAMPSRGRAWRRKRPRDGGGLREARPRRRGGLSRSSGGSEPFWKRTRACQPVGMHTGGNNVDSGRRLRAPVFARAGQTAHLRDFRSVTGACRTGCPALPACAGRIQRDIGPPGRNSRPVRGTP